MGRRHAANARDLGYAVTAYDPDEGSRIAVAAVGIDVTDRPADAFAGDIAIIATPASTHSDYLAQAIDADMHAFVEKPFSDSMENLDELLERARSKGLNVGVAQNLRHHPAVEAAASLLRAGALGQVMGAVSVGASYLPDWRPGKDYRDNYAADPKGGGVIFDWVHEIDMLVHLLGPAKVAGAAAVIGRHLDMASDESAGIVLDHIDGVLSTLYLTYASRPSLRQTMLFGLDGRLEIDIPARRLRLFNKDGTIAEDTVFGGMHADDYKSELADFIESINGNTSPRCSGREALDILKIVTDARAMAGLPSRDQVSR
jgi:predicted dehydrogenase